MSKAVFTCLGFGTLWGMSAAAIVEPLHGLDTIVVGSSIWIAAAIAGGLVYFDARRPRTQRQWFGFVIAGTLAGAWLGWPPDWREVYRQINSLPPSERFLDVRLYAPILGAVAGALAGIVAETICSRIVGEKAPRPLADIHEMSLKARVDVPLGSAPGDARSEHMEAKAKKPIPAPWWRLILRDARLHATVVFLLLATIVYSYSH